MACLPPGWHRKVIQRKNGASVDKNDLTNVLICGPNQREFRSRNDLKNYFQKIGENDLDPDDFDFSVYGTNAKKDNFNDKKNGQERFQCDLCEEIFISLIDVKGHINEMHKQNPPKVGIEPRPKDLLTVENKAMKETEVPIDKEMENYICGISDKSESVKFKEIHTINKNQNENLSFTCDKCKKVFVNSQELKLHQNYICGKSENVEFLTTKIKKRNVPCDKCNKKFLNSHKLKLHEQNVHKEKTNNRKEVSEIVDPKNPKQILGSKISYENLTYFKCKFCTMNFEDLKSLMVHINKSHKV